MKVQLDKNLEAHRPIKIQFGELRFRLTEKEAQALCIKLNHALIRIANHVQCCGETQNYGFTFRCRQRGIEKDGGCWYCKQHARKS